MSTSKATRPGPPQKTCTECRRRHQKCKPRKDGPCSNCMRRFPPPECTLYILQAERRNEHESPDLGALDALWSLKPFGGVLTAINSLNSVPVKPTLRNAELFHLFHQFVVPKLSSIDGTTSTGLYIKTMVPWMIQSSLMPNITILMASFAQGMHQGHDVNKRPETLALKAKSLSLLNDLLAQDFQEVGRDTLLAVIHIASLEFIWGPRKPLLSHMKGIKEMLRLRGGFANLNDPVLGWALIMVDYEVAIRFETDVYLQPPKLLALIPDTPPTTSPPASLMGPLLPFPTTFAEVAHALPICKEAAEILDDISFLTSSIMNAEPGNTTKIRSTASWLHERVTNHLLLDIPETASDADKILAIICLTALAYTASISTLAPLSQTYTPSMLSELYVLFSNFTPAGLKKWNAIPGILFWVLLTAVPSSEDDILGRFLRCKLPPTRIVLGLGDFNLPTRYSRTFWKVQRWIDLERECEEGKE